MNKIIKKTTTLTPAAIRETRLAAGLSQAQAAALCGVSTSAWAHWEQGFRSPSSAAATLIKLLPELVERDILIVNR